MERLARSGRSERSKDRSAVSRDSGDSWQQKLSIKTVGMIMKQKAYPIMPSICIPVSWASICMSRRSHWVEKKTFRLMIHTRISGHDYDIPLSSSFLRLTSAAASSFMRSFINKNRFMISKNNLDTSNNVTNPFPVALPFTTFVFGL